ncbi:MAG: zinc ribbon domain-containing protein [Bryobacteraceae bacterium]|nr:zinc ribbon domain-containing protein [Bryobacteraceae bacterium]
MPIYEYLCEDCGTRFEKLVRSSDTAGPACPSCGEAHLKRELSTFAAHANGRSPDSAPMPGGCPAGMCRTPGLCGRN